MTDPRYIELHIQSAFSFLEGASLPEDLAVTASELGLPAAALVDLRGLYGAPRFFKAAKLVNFRALVGAEIEVVDDDKNALGRLVLLIPSRDAYKALCRLLTESALHAPKGESKVTWSQLAANAKHFICLTDGASQQTPSPLPAGRDEVILLGLKEIFEDRLYIELQRHHILDEERHNQQLITLARKLDIPLVATNGVRYTRPIEKDIADIFTCLRLHTTLDNAGSRLDANRERHLKSASEMIRLFRDIPEAIENTVRISERLQFTLKDLGYQFPDYPLRPGETPMSELRRLTWEAAPSRFPVIDAKVRTQIEKELAMIEKLDLPGYFLIVWDIIQFCKREKIFVQGRGSAANSAVCFALSITAVDPIKMELLFERFLSEERGEWPDIDLDLPSGDQREKVIQHLYHKYGRWGAAMTANVIQYQSRSAMRDVAKVLGYTPDEVQRLSTHVSSRGWSIQPDPEALNKGLKAAGFSSTDRKISQLIYLCRRVQGLPRHLGQHSGGMVVSRGRLDEVAPLEPASMPGRVVIQWDKEDCADLGIIKIDLLGLGMLQVLEEAMEIIKVHEKKIVDLAQLPDNDPAVYSLLQKADTIGLFQVESRAQMASLPQHPPRIFYDIVTQIALVRPGPILGGMMQPFYKRFQDKNEPVIYPHPLLEPILKRTLGVPLFQEQILRIAIEAAGFSGGEAEQLRRAMGWKRSEERMAALERRLREGMMKKGIDTKACDQIVRLIFSFAEYGFPESHAASFALLAYASGYLKVHHPAAFYAALLNAWPMGFYHPATLVKDAQRRGVIVDPIDVQTSGWSCRWVDQRRFRLGLRFVKGLSAKTGARLEAEQNGKPFRDSSDLAYRTHANTDELEALAYSGAFMSFGITRRAALWQAAQLGPSTDPLFAGIPLDDDSPLPTMSAQEETRADYESCHLTTGPHLMAHWRAELTRQKISSAARLKMLPQGSRVTTAGCIIVRQQPGTAKGFVFLTLEDETGMSQAIIHPGIYQQYRNVIIGSNALVVEGILQKDHVNVSIKLQRARALEVLEPIGSKNFS